MWFCLKKIAELVFYAGKGSEAPDDECQNGLECTCLKCTGGTYLKRFAPPPDLRGSTTFSHATVSTPYVTGAGSATSSSSTTASISASSATATIARNPQVVIPIPTGERARVSSQ